MSLYEGAGQLSRSTAELLRSWEETKAGWSDAVSRSFEEKYLVPLRLDAKNAVGAMSRMSVVLDQIRRECS